MDAAFMVVAVFTQINKHMRTTTRRIYVDNQNENILSMIANGFHVSTYA